MPKDRLLRCEDLYFESDGNCTFGAVPALGTISSDNSPAVRRRCHYSRKAHVTPPWQIPKAAQLSAELRRNLIADFNALRAGHGITAT
jgi:hypothetical protein